MCVKASFLDDNLEQQAKYEWFSALITVRTRKARTNQVAYCFWYALPLRTNRYMYHYRSAPSSTCSYMSKDRSACSPDTVKP